MSEDREPDWLAELAKGGEALRRQLESIVQAAEQLAASGPARPLAQGITRAVGELLSAPKRPVAHQATAELATAIGTAAAAATATVTASGSAVVRPSGLTERSVGQILALVLLAIATWRLLVVPERDRAAMDHYLTVLSFALPIAVLIWTWNKRK